MPHRLGWAKGHGLRLYRPTLYGSEAEDGGGGGGPTKLYTPLRVVKNTIANYIKIIIIILIYQGCSRLLDPSGIG